MLFLPVLKFSLHYYSMPRDPSWTTVLPPKSRWSSKLFENEVPNDDTLTGTCIALIGQ